MSNTIENRVNKLRKEMKRNAMAAVVLTSHPSIRWTCGFSGSNGALVITHSDQVLLTDDRYEQRAQSELQNAGSSSKLVINRDFNSEIKKLLSATGENTQSIAAPTAPNKFACGIETARLSWQKATQLAKELTGSTEISSISEFEASQQTQDLAIVAFSYQIEALRRDKDDQETASIKTAAAIADQALKEVIAAGIANKSERKLAFAVESAIRSQGADDIAFDAIVASGPNSAIPHHKACDRLVEPGDLVIFDIGANYNGYCSDMTRTFLLEGVDEQQSQQSKKLLKIVAEAQNAAIAKMQPGLGAKEVDLAARRVIESYGFGEYFKHGTGHGLGLEIHEGPWLNATSEDVLTTKSIATIEPGIYMPGFGGVRIEDTCLPTALGGIALTAYEKSFESSLLNTEGRQLKSPAS